MKVALVAEWLDPWRGGAETSTLQFVHHLTEASVELHVFTRSRPSPTPHLHVHTISGASMSRSRRSMTFARRVENLLRADSFDVIHAISPCRGADIYQPRGGTVAETIQRNLALRKTGVARSLKRWANPFNIKQRHMLTLERQIIGNEDGPIVVAISRYVARQLREHYNLPDGRIRTVYNGVDPDNVKDDERARDRSAIRKEFGVADDDLLVLLIAHNFRLKGVARWMEALALLNRGGITNVRSVVIGKGETRRWHHLAARLGIAQQLMFAGPSDRVRALRCAGDVLIHPTYYDPCSRVVLEAMAAGLPCITTSFDGASEMIEDGVNGYVVADPADVTGLADRVERLLDGNRRLAMSEAATAVTQHVTMERHVRAMLTVYEEIVARNVR